jgi:hypothetical protein
LATVPGFDPDRRLDSFETQFSSPTSPGSSRLRGPKQKRPSRGLP